MGFLSTIVGGITSIFGGSNKRKAEEAAHRAKAEQYRAEQLANMARIEEAKARAAIKANAAASASGGSSGGMGKNMPYILAAAGAVLAVVLSKKK